MLRVFFAAILAFFVCHLSELTPVLPVENLWNLILMGVAEMTVGIVLAFVADMIYLPFRLVGIQVEHSAGFGQGETINPDDNTTFSIVQQFMNILGILVFFLLDGHHLLIRMIVLTFQWIPLGGVVLKGEMIKVLVGYFGKVFALGIGYAAPIMGCVMIGSLCFGILGKSVPQMNLLIIDLPVRIAVGLIGLVICLPMLIALFQKFLTYTGFTLEKLILLMSVQKHG